jgi:hypothetical protein
VVAHHQGLAVRRHPIQVAALASEGDHQACSGSTTGPSDDEGVSRSVAVETTADPSRLRPSGSSPGAASQQSPSSPSVGTTPDHRAATGRDKSIPDIEGDDEPVPKPTVTEPDSHGLRPGERGHREGAASVQPVLLQIVTRINQHYGTKLNALALARPFADTIADLGVRRAALANEEEAFGIVFDRVFTHRMAAHFDKGGDLSAHYFSGDPAIRNALTVGARGPAWRLIRAQDATRGSFIEPTTSAPLQADPCGSVSPAALARVAAADPPRGSAPARITKVRTPQPPTGMRQAGRPRI